MFLSSYMLPLGLIFLPPELWPVICCTDDTALCSLAVSKSCCLSWGSSPLQAHGGNSAKPHPSKKWETKLQTLLSLVIGWIFCSTPDILSSLQLCHLYSSVHLIHHCNYPKQKQVWLCCPTAKQFEHFSTVLRVVQN